MGLVSLDPFDMKLLLQTNPDDTESPEEKKLLQDEQYYAGRILPFLQDHHRLLVTLLLVNALANETLPLLLNSLGLPKGVNVVISVIGVLVFGEVLPSAIFTGKNQLEIASFLTPLVRTLQLVLAFVVVPIARVLDYVLGVEHKGRYNKAELKALVTMQLKRLEEDQGLHEDEVKMMHGAMELSKKTVSDDLCMLPLNRVFMIEQSEELDIDKMAILVGKGHSRVPVYDKHPHDIRGFLMVKNLIVISPEDRRRVSSFGLRRPLVVSLD